MMLQPHRRGLIAGAAATAGLAALPAQAAPLGLRAAAKTMALFGLPLIETAATRARVFRNGGAANALRHSRGLTTPKSQTVTQPNNDTLYSSGWLDLSGGPVRITLPATGDRYFSLALMDPYSNNFAVLGTRTTSGEGGQFTVVGPSHPAPSPGVIRSPTDWVWALARTLVVDEADLPAGHAIQDAIRIDGPAGRRAGPFAGRDAAWPDYFAAVQALVQESPPPATDARLFLDARALGLRPAGGFDAKRFSTAEGQEIAAGLAEALQAAKGADDSAVVQGDWIFPRANLGDFGQDYLYRAQIALSGLAGLPVDEALYMRPLGPDGRAELDSRKSWRLTFPGDALPPVDAFWSLTSYEVTPQGQAFLIDNPINRYAIGDRTPGLVRGADGGIDIWISSAAPSKPGINWLPAPTNGRPLLLNLRAYLPRPELLAGRYKLPTLRQA